MDFPSQILSWLAFIAQKIIEGGGYPGLVLFMIVASMNIPIPSEVAYGFSGFLSARGSFALVAVIVVGALANSLGASLNYWVGAKRRKNHNPDSHFLFVSPHEIQRAERWFSRWGSWGVFFGHLLPAVRAVISFPAGFFGIKFSKFITLTIFASFIWATSWASLGYKLGVEWERVSVYARKFDVLILILLVVGALWWVKKHLLIKRS